MRLFGEEVCGYVIKISRLDSGIHWMWAGAGAGWIRKCNNSGNLFI